MKIEEFTTTPMSNGRVQIMFTEPLYEDDYGLSLFLDYFKRKDRKNKIDVYREMKPKIKIFGLSCKKKIWANFLVKIKRNELAKGWYDAIRDIPFKSVEEVISCLRLLQDAEIC